MGGGTPAMGVNWRSVLVAGLVTAAGATGVYYLLSQQQPAKDASVDADAKAGAANGASKRRRQRKKGRRSTSAAEVESPSLTDINSARVYPEKAVVDLAMLCDKPLDVLIELEAETKQKVFYALLLKGEAVMNVPGQEPAASAKYFAKALALVPNPSEIMSAFEKSLNPAVFQEMIKLLQQEMLHKTDKYFERLAEPAGGRLAFAAATENDILGKGHRVHRPVAQRALKAGEVVFEEVPDVASLIDLNADMLVYCDNCLKQLGDHTLSCGQNDAFYCSPACQKTGIELYHGYVCTTNAAACVALGELRRYCKEVSHSGIALLLLKYVAMLLTEELRGNGATLGGPFDHYDNLPQLFPAPGELETEEARLIRAVFASVNANIADFLTDQIYASMKATLSRASFSFAVDNPLAVNNTAFIEAFRKVIGGNQDCDAMAFYRLAAHLPHACAPNVKLELVPGCGSMVRAVALRDVAAGEGLAVAFVPVDGLEAQRRKDQLFLHFMIDCQCAQCIQQKCEMI